MKKIIFILASSFLLFSAVQAQQKFNLLQDSLIIETHRVTAQRELVLWMEEAQKHPRRGDKFYSCPDETRGSYYEGKTRISLIDTQTQKLSTPLKLRKMQASLSIYHI